MYKEFFEFKLNQPIDNVIKELVLYAPRAIHRPNMGKLESMLMNGMMRFQKEVQKEDQPQQNVSGEESENPFENVNALEIVAMLKAVPSDDYTFFPIFCDVFKGLMISSQICKIKHNNHQLGEGDYDKLSSPDLDRLMGEYIKNFFTLSVSS